MRSWLSRDSSRTLRPNSTIGATTRGTTARTSKVSLGLVTNSITMPPMISSALRSAMETEEPTTTCSKVVSVVRRETTSPVRVISKKPGLKPMM
jgi:hypothetical protein